MNRDAGAIFGACEPVDTMDASGRMLTVRPPHALDRLRLFRAVGPELAQNTIYLGMALTACAVIAIDGVPVPPPTSDHQIEQIVARLGDAGLRAASLIVGRELTDPEVREDAGKLSRHPDLIECLYLVKNGVPFDIAFALPAVWRRAFTVAIGEMSGAQYDWQAMRWDGASTTG